MPNSNLARVAAPTAPRPAAIRHLTPLSSPVPAPATPRDSRRQSKLRIPVLVIVGSLLAVNLWGVSYYAAPAATRVRHALHPLLKSSGLVGQSAGIVAFVIFVFLWLYPLRKRWKALAFTGPIGKWLDVHVTAALGLPLLLAIHSAWRSGGVIGLGTDAMLVVCASGVIGRYLYTRIPRAKSGVELTREEVVAERQGIITRIAESTGIERAVVSEILAVAPPSSGGAGALEILRRLLTDDLARWRKVREVERELRAKGRARVDAHALKRAVQLAGREIALEQQARMLEATQRIFRWWHVAHRPFAITAFVAVAIHVVVVVAVGATWFY